MAHDGRELERPAGRSAASLRRGHRAQVAARRGHEGDAAQRVRGGVASRGARGRGGVDACLLSALRNQGRAPDRHVRSRSRGRRGASPRRGRRRAIGSACGRGLARRVPRPVLEPASRRPRAADDVGGRARARWATATRRNACSTCTPNLSPTRWREEQTTEPSPRRIRTSTRGVCWRSWTSSASVCSRVNGRSSKRARGREEVLLAGAGSPCLV